MTENLIVANWLGYKRLDDGGCEVKNYADGGTTITLDPDEYRLLRRIKDDDIEMDEIEGDEFLEGTLMKLIDLGMLRFKKTLYSDHGVTHHTIHMFRKHKSTGIPRICMLFGTYFIMILGILSMLYVLWFVYKYKININIISESLFLPHVLVATVVGIALHEAGHLISAFAYGAHVFEAGFITHWGLISGAYIMEDSSYTCNRIERIQIKMAGLEINAILSAASLMMALAVPDSLGRFGVCAASINMCMVLLNTISKESDGMTAIQEILKDKHIERSILRAFLFFLMWKKFGMGKGKKQSALHFVVFYMVGIIRLIPILYFTYIGGLLLGVRLKLGGILYWLVFASMVYVLGLMLWTVVSFTYDFVRAFSQDD